MESDKLAVIKKLMEKLESLMTMDADDFDARLGKAKPEVEVVKVEGKVPMDGEEMAMDGLDEEDDEDDLAGRIASMRG